MHVLMRIFFYNIKFPFVTIILVLYALQLLLVILTSNNCWKTRRERNESRHNNMSIYMIGTIDTRAKTNQCHPWTKWEIKISVHPFKMFTRRCYTSGTGTTLSRLLPRNELLKNLSLVHFACYKYLTHVYIYVQGLTFRVKRSLPRPSHRWLQYE